MGLIALGSLLFYSNELYQRLQIVGAIETTEGDGYPYAGTCKNLSGTDGVPIGSGGCKPKGEHDAGKTPGEEKALSYRDVNAQEGMRAAAYWMVGVSLVQIVVGIGGVILLVRTLEETHKTAVASLATVTVAERARKDADRHANLQSRAYVYVEHARLLKPDKEKGRQTHLIEISVKNYGQTPAHDVTFTARYDIREHPLNGPSVDGENITMGPCSLAPGAGIVFHLPFWPIHAFHLPTIEGGSMALFVIGDIAYRDVFVSDDLLKSIPFTDFMLTYCGAVSATTGLFANYTDGNSAG